MDISVNDPLLTYLHYILYTEIKYGSLKSIKKRVKFIYTYVFTLLRIIFN